MTTNTNEITINNMSVQEPADIDDTQSSVTSADLAGSATTRVQLWVENMCFAISPDRLYQVTKKGEDFIERFVSSLIIVIAEARDNASSSWGKVVCFNDRDGVEKRLYVRNRDICTDGKAIIKALVEEGLQVSTDTRMVDALLHYINLAPPHEEKRAICTDRIGWHGNIYLLPDNSVLGSADRRVVYTGAPIGSHHATKGTLEEWQYQVAVLCKGNSMLTLGLCITFASVLLRRFKIESGGFHLYGESSTGKSTTLYVAASVCGEPEEQIKSWHSTVAGAEARAKQCNDSLMINDELHQTTPKEAGAAAYKLFNGKGKVRSSILCDARPVAEWRLNCLSSGEIAYASFIKDGGTNVRAGQAVRMVDISADMEMGFGVFENIHDSVDSHEFAELLKKRCSNYYGTPIRAFINEVINCSDQLEQAFADVKARFFTDFIPAGSESQVQRVATKFALAAFAGEFATEKGITGWGASDGYDAIGRTFTKWLGSRGTTGQLEAERSLEQVKYFLLRHGMSRFIPASVVPAGGYKQDTPDRTYNNMAGYRITNNDNAYEFIVFPEVYINEMCAGLNPQTVTKAVADRGFIELDPAGKSQVRRRLPGLGQMRVYHFNAKMFDETDEFDSGSIVLN